MTSLDHAKRIVRDLGLEVVVQSSESLLVFDPSHGPYGVDTDLTVLSWPIVKLSAPGDFACTVGNILEDVTP